MTARYEHFSRGDTFDDEAGEAPDREISLGTTTVLGIFVALALICGVFFGFGYSMGRRSMAPALGNVDSHVSAPPASSPTVADGPDADSPPPGGSPARDVVEADHPAARIAANTPRAASPVKPSASLASPADLPRESTPKTSTADRSAAVSPAAPRVSGPASTPAAKVVGAPPGSAPAAAVSVPSSAQTAVPAASGAATPTYVQVAAISHREDADLLLASLRRRGYAAAIRQQPQDNLLHIQIGPLATKEEANTMRKRLLADGYNAIVK